MVLYSIASFAALFAVAKAASANEQVTVAPSTTEQQVTKAITANFVQTSPAWLAHIKAPRNVVRYFPRDEDIKAGPLPKEQFILDVATYPAPNKQPPVDHPEVQAVLKQIDFTIIPDSQPRIIKDWAVDLKGYSRLDPDCWWSASLCKKPKVSYIPEDISFCPDKGIWGLNYDDGPYKSWWPTSEKDKEYDQPRFYNYLIGLGKQKATLFFVGSNVINFPAGAQRALKDGHTICSHTWSHPQMTTLTNEEVVAQLYWTQKAIKETLGITPKCWRPPYGDVDDRVRAIAYQMGMRTVLWDQDSYDWSLYSGTVKAETVDTYFDNWIKKRLAGNDTEHGHITLQHENSNVTIRMSEKWLPKLQEAFTVMPIHQCINDPQPYWEEAWVYPTIDVPEPPRPDYPIVSSASSLSNTVAETLFTLALSGLLYLIQ